MSLTHGVRDWNGYRPGRELFATGPLTDAQALRDLIDEESFLAVECTGFAHSDQLGQKIGDKPEAQHRIGGVLSLRAGCPGGPQQLDRPIGRSSSPSTSLSPTTVGASSPTRWRRFPAPG